jgi:hypothetical protein
LDICLTIIGLLESQLSLVLRMTLLEDHFIKHHNDSENTHHGGSGLLGSYLLRMFRQSGYDQLTATFQNNAISIPHDLKEGIEWKPLKLPDAQDTFDIVQGKDWVIHSAG